MSTNSAESSERHLIDHLGDGRLTKPSGELLDRRPSLETEGVTTTAVASQWVERRVMFSDRGVPHEDRGLQIAVSRGLLSVAEKRSLPTPG
jgi:hypothetical protein